MHLTLLSLQEEIKEISMISMTTRQQPLLLLCEPYDLLYFL